jgi:hypothetical protein
MRDRASSIIVGDWSTSVAVLNWPSASIADVISPEPVAQSSRLPDEPRASSTAIRSLSRNP